MAAAAERWGWNNPDTLARMNKEVMSSPCLSLRLQHSVIHLFDISCHLSVAPSIFGIILKIFSCVDVGSV